MTGQQKRILLADDDLRIGSLVVQALEREGFAVDHLADGGEVVERVLGNGYDAVILDWMLPLRSGLDCCGAIRRESPIPILMLTARAEEADLIRALELCADDYVAKPFSMPELVVRVRSLLRRRELDRAESRREHQGAAVAAPQSAATITVDTRRREVRVEGRLVDLTGTEFDLLALLSTRPAELFTREELMRHLWQTTTPVDSRACDFHVRNLRHKIEADPQRPVHLLTVRGRGYRLVGVRTVSP